MYLRNAFVESALTKFQGTIMFVTRPELIADASKFFAECSTGRDLIEYGKRLAGAGLSNHDRRLLGAMYKVKEQILKELGQWELRLK